MHATLLFSTLTLLSASLTTALPSLTPRTQQFFTINLSNDVSGANAIRSVVVNSGAVSFSTLFANTALQRDGRIIATSVQNVMPVGGSVECVIKGFKDGGVKEINDRVTFVDLDGVEGGSVETDVSDLSITCEL